jgi:hypothetical protein
MMKSYWFCLSAFLFFMAACATEKHPGPPELTVAEKALWGQECTDIFPKGRWQFVHSIDFTMGDGAGATVVGVITLNEKDIECALFTHEGLTLFEAVFPNDKSFKVGRTVPPFDNPEFAKGLVRDIQMIFQPPPGAKVRTGKSAGGTVVCRYSSPGLGVVDILPESDNCWQIKSYTPELALDRWIVGQSCKRIGSSLIPGYLELHSLGRNSYTLKMKMIRADNLE